MFYNHDEDESNDGEPTGDDLLWWNPKVIHPYETTIFLRTYHCDKCDVRWREDPKVKVRCWCCGKFHKRKWS